MSPNYSSLYRLGLSKSLGIGQFYEHIIEALYGTVLCAGDTCIDGGVNRGQHTFNMSNLVGTSGLVIGFEALPCLANSINQRIAREGIGNIKIIAKAIGNFAGSTAFTQVVDADGYSGIRQRTGIPLDYLASARVLEVPCTTIDLELDRLGGTCAVPRFIKLDLEGGELHALMGARQLLARKQTLVVFENGCQESAAVYGYSRGEWFDFMASIDYRVFDLFGRPFGPSDWSRHEIPWYFIAVPAAKADWLHFIDHQYAAMIVALAARLGAGGWLPGSGLVRRLASRLWR